MTMFQRILLPLDLTDRHTEALEYAEELACAGGEVILLHVVEMIPGLGRAEEKPFYSRLERVARKYLDPIAARFAEKKVRCRVEVRLGNRAREAIRFTTEVGADVIILTAPTFDPENPALVGGSLAWRISVLSPCPVLLAKHREKKGQQQGEPGE
jgi:nucleotide-binding universal stress UspA family protein